MLSVLFPTQCKITQNPMVVVPQILIDFNSREKYDLELARPSVGIHLSRHKENYLAHQKMMLANPSHNSISMIMMRIGMLISIDVVTSQQDTKALSERKGLSKNEADKDV